jgi:hypothetical protein
MVPFWDSTHPIPASVVQPTEHGACSEASAYAVSARGGMPERAAYVATQRGDTVVRAAVSDEAPLPDA